MDYMPMKKFDEVRLALYAIEMSQNHQWFVIHYEGIPELWSTKPPLLTWVQVLCIKIIGINEIAFRLPSALAVLGICFIIYLFVLKELQNKYIACFAIIILITTNGFVHMHGARSGDYDSFLCLFLFIQAISFYSYLKTKQFKFLIYYSLSIICACLTKSIAGLFFLPGFYLYILIERKFKFIFDWRLISSFLVSIFTVLLYYFYRESLSPGYLKAVQYNELGGRFLSTIDGHSHAWWFYINLFFKDHFVFWYFFLFFGIILAKLSSTYNQFIKFVFSIVFSFIFILSIAKTKISWYDMPIYPLLAIITAIGVYNVYTLINENKKIYGKIFLGLIFLVNYFPMFLNSFKAMIPIGEIEDYRLCYYIKSHASDIAKNKKIHFKYDGYQPQNKFYEYYLKDKYPNLIISKNIDSGTFLYIVNQNLKIDFENNHIQKLISDDENISVYLSI